VLEIFQELIVEVNLKVVTGSMHHIVIPAFALIGGNTSIKCHFSNICVENQCNCCSNFTSYGHHMNKGD